MSLRRQTGGSDKRGERKVGEALMFKVQWFKSTRTVSETDDGAEVGVAVTQWS